MTVPVLFLKAHVSGYTRRSGTYVRPHERGAPQLGRVLAAAHQADAAIEGTPAGDLVQSFVGHQHDAWRSSAPGFGIWSQRRLEEAFGPHPSYQAEVARADLERAFAPVRETLRREFGPTIRLYRAQAPVPEGAEPRVVLSWTADRRIAEWFAGLEHMPKPPATPEQIAAAVAQYERTGAVKFRGKLYKRQPDSNYYDIYQVFRGGGLDFLTDGDDLLWDLTDDAKDRQAMIDDRLRKARPILAADVPVDDIVWITNRANQREFIVRNRGAAAHGPAPTMVKALPHPARPAQPTEAQKEAGNYAMERMTFQGLPITIENPRGSIRSGRDRGGHEWSVSMAHHYGYIRGTRGTDGDHYDVYVGPNAEAEHAYIVMTRAPPDFTREDEQKAMLGFNSEEEAKAAYLAHYDNPRFFGGIRAMPMAEFKAKVLDTAEGDGLVKSFVHAHERRLRGGKIVFVKPYSKRGAPVDQPDLFSMPAAPAKPVISPEQGILATDDFDRTLPGFRAVAQELQQRLAPDHVFRLHVIEDARESMGRIWSDERDIRYGEENHVEPALTGAHDFQITINRVGRDGQYRSTTAMLQTLLHEFGHASQFTRFRRAPRQVQDAILEQWQAETHGLPARSIEDGPPRRATMGERDVADVVAVRQWLTMGIPADQIQEGVDRGQPYASASNYHRHFEEWWAEAFARWMVSKPHSDSSPITRFFEQARRNLAEAWRAAMRMLGIQPQQIGGAIERFFTDVWEGRMAKAILFLKAIIPGGAAGDLFGEKVTVEGHTRGGTYVAPYQATRKKKAEKPPQPPISADEANRIAREVFAWNSKRPKSAGSASFAAMLSGWQHATRHGEISFDNEGTILTAMQDRAKKLAAGIDPDPKPVQQGGLAPAAESDMARSHREWADNYSRVTGAADLSKVSAADIRRAIGYATHAMVHAEGAEMRRGIKREMDHLEAELANRRKVAEMPAKKVVLMPTKPQGSGLDLRHVLLEDHDIARFAKKPDAAAFAKKRGWNAYDVVRAFNRFQEFWVVGERLPDGLRLATRAPGDVRIPYRDAT